MKTVVEKINQILAEWDPIGVGEAIAINEYKGYIPIILKSINNREILMDCLINILVNDIGVGYDPSNESHVKNLQQISERIMQVYTSLCTK